MAGVEQRFLTGYREEDTDEPGLVLEDDGSVWHVKADGTREQLSGGGGGSLPSQWTVDENGNLLIEAAPAAFNGENGFAGILIKTTDDANTFDCLMILRENDDTGFAVSPNGDVQGGTASLNPVGPDPGAPTVKIIGAAGVNQPNDNIAAFIDGVLRFQLDTDGNLTLRDSAGAARLKVDDDGVHIKTGTSILADL